MLQCWEMIADNRLREVVVSFRTAPQRPSEDVDAAGTFATEDNRGWAIELLRPNGAPFAKLPRRLPLRPPEKDIVAHAATERVEPFIPGSEG